MSINSAEKQAEKVLEYVQSLATSDSKLYDKSKQRLEYISKLCFKITNTISKVTQNDVTIEADSYSDLLTKVDYQSKEITYIKNLLKSFINVQSNSVETISEPIQQKCKTKKLSRQIKNSEHNSITSKDMREIVSQYGETLKELANTDCEVKAANQCASILWKWFEARIFKKYPNAPTFNYSIYRIRSIIYSIVIVYGYYSELGKLDKFLQHFENWIDSLSTSEQSNKWIAPYEIYQVERNMTKKYANLTSVVIWDILLDHGLIKLCNLDNHKDTYLMRNEIWEMVESIDMDILDPYQNYKYDSNILESLNLI